jgi:hypothetical protein
VASGSLADCQGWHGRFRKRVDDSHLGDADGDDPLDQVDDVARIGVFVAPCVGVVDDAGGIAGFRLVALDDPFQRGAGALSHFFRTHRLQMCKTMRT